MLLIFFVEREWEMLEKLICDVKRWFGDLFWTVDGVRERLFQGSRRLVRCLGPGSLRRQMSVSSADDSLVV